MYLSDPTVMDAAREEERRRLGRDLHDGLGPALAGIAVQLEVTAGLVVRDPDAAAQTLARLGGELQDAIADMRRLVYEMRPPTLDELGLVGAIRERADRIGAGRDRGLRVDVLAGELPPLPESVEVAAYRILSEALTNAVRHARARRCVVRIAAGTELRLEVEDDGEGIGPDRSPGVGLGSMRERAEELGGSFEIGPGPGGGTLVQASLPGIRALALA